MVDKIRSLISINDLSKEEILFLIKLAQDIQKSPQKFVDITKGKILSLLFFEPSTRTYFSFCSAMQRLGGSTLGFSQIESTSVAKGETIEDTARIMASYSDIMAVRHAEVGTLQRIAKVVNIPVISGGEGVDEHPTQTLSDLFTIYKHFNKLNITIAVYNDLKYGRTSHSLILAASKFGADFICIAPNELQMPKEYIEQAEKNGSKIIFADKIDNFVDKIDVLYVTRLQKERLPSHLDYEKLKSQFKVDLHLLSRLKESSIIMHPLPRITEIDIAVDQDPRAKYFEQAANGVAMRMAILKFYLKIN